MNVGCCNESDGGSGMVRILFVEVNHPKGSFIDVVVQHIP